MSRAGQVTGAVLLVIVGVMVFAGWRLYDRAVRVHSRQTLGEALIEAVDHHSASRASELIAQGADINVREQQSDRTPLMAAADSADAVLITLLLEHGAEINTTDAMGATPLSHLLASKHATLSMVKPLVSNTVAARYMQRNATSQLELAIQTHDPQIVGLLLDAGANPGQMDMGGRSILMEAVQADDLPVVKQLVAYGALSKSRAGLAGPPLHAALNLGDDALAQYLVTHRADPNSLDRNGDTALIAAVQNNLPASFAALLARGARVNAANKKGETALIVAAREGRREMVNALLQRAADTSRRDSTTRTALAWAKDQGFGDIEITLRNGGAMQ